MPPFLFVLNPADDHQLDTIMESLNVSAFISFTLAILLLFVGKAFTQFFEVLRRYSIPEALIGGFLCSLGCGLIYWCFGLQISFELEVRELLLLYFFSAIGLRADIMSLISGGRALTILLALASSFIVLQNLVGMGMSSMLGLDPKAGLMLGSISLTGGVATTDAWSSYFTNQLGIHNAFELGIASNTMGLIAACLIGGPIARHLIMRHQLQANNKDALDVGLSFAKKKPKLDYYSVLWAWMWLNLCVLLGDPLHQLLSQTGLTLPSFVSCLLIGIIIRNTLPPLRRFLLRKHLMSRRIARASSWLNAREGLALISDICLGMFLTMAMMSLKLWQLDGVFGLILLVISVQIVICVVFILFVVFKLMGKDYEAAVICAGFGGIGLGSTATAIVNMTAVTRQYGAANRAFILVPLVCGFFIDLVNTLVINLMVIL